MKKQNTRRLVTIAAIVLGCFGSYAASAKNLVQQKKPESAIKMQKSEISAYLFFNGKDQDSGCSQIYSLFDELSAKLPDTAKKMKLDVNSEDRSFFKTYNVLVLPTILLVDNKGNVLSRIEGEGREIEGKIRAAFLKASQGSGKK